MDDKQKKILEIIVVIILLIIIGFRFSAKIFIKKSLLVGNKKTANLKSKINIMQDKASVLLKKSIGKKNELIDVDKPKIQYIGRLYRDPLKSVLENEKKEEEPTEKIKKMPIVLVSPQEIEELKRFISIKGIIWGVSTPQAIINDQIVTIGDEIEGFRERIKISKIRKKGIVLIYKGQKILIDK